MDKKGLNLLLDITLAKANMSRGLYDPKKFPLLAKKKIINPTKCPQLLRMEIFASNNKQWFSETLFII
jgi:hypothetical protein